MHKDNLLTETKSKGKEVRKMRNVLALLAAITLILSTSGVASADYGTVIDDEGSPCIETFEARVTPGGVGGMTVDFEANLKNLTGDGPAPRITWSGVLSGTTGWLISNQYIAVKGFANFAEGWGIQIYTNNTDYSGTGNPAGLIQLDNPIYSLPMCWRTKVGYVDPDSATGAPQKPGSGSINAQERQILQGIIQDAEGNDVTVLYDGVPGHEPGGTDAGEDDYFPWFFMLDKRTDIDDDPDTVTYFGNYHLDTTFIGDRGYHHAPGDIPLNFATPSDPNDTYYVYLGANFTLSVPGKEYITDTITAEMYHL